MDLFAGHLPELIIVLVLILIIWGPSKLTDVSVALGRGIREFRKASAETREAVRTAAAMPVPTPPEEPTASTAAQAVPAPERESPLSPGAPPA